MTFCVIFLPLSREPSCSRDFLAGLPWWGPSLADLVFVATTQG